MIVVNPDQYLLPTYRISPFDTPYISINARLNNSDFSFTDNFKNFEVHITYNGRNAINCALSHYKLKKDDFVTIFTTTDNFYISGCVTKEIEKFCKWSRKIEPNTKVLFINHEFGYVRKDVAALKKLGYPIIEDFAYSYFDVVPQNFIGDFALISLPKLFPIQIGAILFAQKGLSNVTIIKSTNHISELQLEYVKKCLNFYVPQIESYKTKRLENHVYLISQLKSINCEERIVINDSDVPGVCLFKTNDKLDLQSLKIHLFNNGVQSSVFYGEDAFYIPVHQNLNKEDMDYIIETIKSFVGV